MVHRYIGSPASRDLAPNVSYHDRYRGVSRDPVYSPNRSLGPLPSAAIGASCKHVAAPEENARRFWAGDLDSRRSWLGRTWAVEHLMAGDRKRKNFAARGLGIVHPEAKLVKAQGSLNGAHC